MLSRVTFEWLVIFLDVGSGCYFSEAREALQLRKMFSRAGLVGRIFVIWSPCQSTTR